MGENKIMNEPKPLLDIGKLDVDAELDNSDWAKRTDDTLDTVMNIDSIVRNGERVLSGPNDATIGREVIKGERALNGYSTYWLFEKGRLKKSISAQTDQEADELLNN